MTEEEAKGKWCPAVRNFMFNRSLAFVETNRGTEVNDKNKGDLPDSIGWAYTCLGSGCMAWRWNQDPNGMPLHSSGGYCGLAGKP